MTEHETFEVRFHTAVHRYVEHVSSDLDPVAFAMRIAAAEPRRHGSTMTLAWGRPRLSRRLLVLLLLTGLLAALLGGALIAGSGPTLRLPAIVPPVAPTARTAFVCPPGTNPNVAGPAIQPRPPISAFPAPMAFDRHAGRIVLLVQGDAVTQTWTFDICANTWAQMHPAREPWGPWLQALVYDVDSNVTVAIGWDPSIVASRVWAYDLEADAWTPKGTLPESLEGQVDVAYDAGSGLIVAMAPTSQVEKEPWGLWSYDVETDTWAAIHETGGRPVGPDPGFQWLAYDASVDRLVWYRLASQATFPYTFETWLFDLRSGTWSQSSAETPSVFEGGFPPVYFANEVAYDEATRLTVVFSAVRTIAYDAGADRWDVLRQGFDPDQPGDGNRDAPSLVYDSANKRLVVYGGTYPRADVNSEGFHVWVRANDVRAFDPVNRAWTVLLPASVAQPEP